ncbi:MAG: Ig-like domain-containing protein [Peptostreptococcaceae bacterium]|nr:Ig-like domain-containing protein [Peptostreptococcaceae bacterium]
MENIKRILTTLLILILSVLSVSQSVIYSDASSGRNIASIVRDVYITEPSGNSKRDGQTFENYANVKLWVDFQASGKNVQPNDYFQLTIPDEIALQGNEQKAFEIKNKSGITIANGKIGKDSNNNQVLRVTFTNSVAQVSVDDGKLYIEATARKNLTSQLGELPVALKFDLLGGRSVTQNIKLFF